MNKLLLSLFVLVVSALPAFAQSFEEEVDACLDGLVRLNPKTTGTILYSGPGTGFEKVMKTYEGRSFLALKTREQDAEGNEWYEIAFDVEQQEETAYHEAAMPLYIRADQVSVHPLTEADKNGAISARFNILPISPKNQPGFILDHPLTLYKFVFGQPEEVLVPASRPLLLFGMITLQDNVPFIYVYEPYYDKGIHFLGEIPLADFEALSFGNAEAAVRVWLEENKKHSGIESVVSEPAKEQAAVLVSSVTGSVGAAEYAAVFTAPGAEGAGDIFSLKATRDVTIRFHSVEFDSETFTPMPGQNLQTVQLKAGENCLLRCLLPEGMPSLMLCADGYAECWIPQYSGVDGSLLPGAGFAANR
ncbi:MAG: hypothetical protein IJD04_05220 [Desulfovibrionaceae bacterium]|nr:hypothetical protein [Desulfovibrionaceae bacterium]